MSELITALNIVGTTLSVSTSVCFWYDRVKLYLDNKVEDPNMKIALYDLFGSAVKNSQVIGPQKELYSRIISKAPTLKSADVAREAIAKHIYVPFADQLNLMDRIKDIFGECSEPNCKESFFTIGSPASNSIVANEFSNWAAKFDLRWNFITKPPEERVCRYSGRELYFEPRFKLNDCEKGVIQAKTEKHRVGEENGADPKKGIKQGKYDFLINDYLLITKGPSRYTIGSREVEHINFSGLHGTGTRAVDNFLSDKELVMKIAKKVNKAGNDGEFYQILVPIKNVKHDFDNRESTPEGIGVPTVRIVTAK